MRKTKKDLERELAEAKTRLDELTKANHDLTKALCDLASRPATIQFVPSYLPAPAPWYQPAPLQWPYDRFTWTCGVGAVEVVPDVVTLGGHTLLDLCKWNTTEGSTVTDPAFLLQS